MVSTLDFESSDPSSNLGRTSLFIFFILLSTSKILVKRYLSVNKNLIVNNDLHGTIYKYINVNQYFKLKTLDDETLRRS